MGSTADIGSNRLTLKAPSWSSLDDEALSLSVTEPEPLRAYKKSFHREHESSSVSKVHPNFKCLFHFMTTFFSILDQLQHSAPGTFVPLFILKTMYSNLHPAEQVSSSDCVVFSNLSTNSPSRLLLHISWCPAAPALTGVEKHPAWRTLLIAELQGQQQHLRGFCGPTSRNIILPDSRNSDCSAQSIIVRIVPARLHTTSSTGDLKWLFHTLDTQQKQLEVPPPHSRRSEKLHRIYGGGRNFPRHLPAEIFSQEIL